MKYRLTALTPLLVGDGQRLSPIDYMVWKDQVNVLDQRRIFKLLARGPRLEGYLAQLKKADTLDFASWGGFAQNFAGRRVPFEHASMTQHWQRASGDSLHIPTFASGPSGPFLPGAAIKGALRTGTFSDSVRDGSLRGVIEKFQGDRPPRRPAESVEEQVLGSSGRSRMRALAVADSAPLAHTAFRIYLVRLATLELRGKEEYKLGWKPNPVFAEMAAPGTVFEGRWQERNEGGRGRIFESVNHWAAQVLGLHKRYAAWTGLDRVSRRIEELEERIAGLAGRPACLLSLGWGGGLLSKSGWIDKDSDEYRQILGALPYYSRAIKSGLPFPKTRRIVFGEDQPDTLPGWALLEVA